MTDLSDYFSDKDEITRLNKQINMIAGFYNEMLSSASDKFTAIECKYKELLTKGLSVRSSNAIDLLKSTNRTHAQIAKTVFLSVYHVNRLSSELKNGLRD